MSARLALLVPALLLAAGCVAPEEAAPEPALETMSVPAALAPLGLAGSSCMEGGGHSVHPRSLWERDVVNVVPEPWVPADVSEDVGQQVVYSEVPDPTRPVPEKGNTMGNYHATMWCDAWTLDGEAIEDVFFGFVGMKVEPPEFDDASFEPATHHYLVTVVATNDEAVIERLRAAGIAAFSATATREALPDGTLRIQMHTDGNGDYDSLFKPQPDGEMHAKRVRLWWQSTPEHGHDEAHIEGAHASGSFRPIALDLVAEGGTHAVAAAQGYFSHSGTEHHAPMPGAYGHTAGILYEGFDRTFEWGPRPDVTLDQAYVH